MRTILSIAAAGALLIPAAASAQLVNGQAGGTVTGGPGSTSGSLNAGVRTHIHTDALNRTAQSARRLETRTTHTARRATQQTRVEAIHARNRARVAAHRATEDGLRVDARATGDTTATRHLHSTMGAGTRVSARVNQNGAKLKANTSPNTGNRPR